MSLERKDIRAKLDGSAHAAVVAICRVRGVEISEYVETLILADVAKVAHEAIELADELRAQGFSGTTRD